MDDVVLGHVAHHVPVEVVVVVEVLAAEEHGSLHRSGVAIEGLEQGGLAGAGRAHQRHQLIREDGERDGVQKALAVGGVDDNVLGLDGDLAVVVALRQLAVFQQLKADAAQADLLACLGQHPAGDADAIQISPVARAEVLDQNARRSAGETGVTPTDHGQIEGNLALGVAPNLHRLAAERDGLEGGLANLDLGLQIEKLRGGDLVGAEVDLVGGLQNGALDAVAQLVDGGSVAGVAVLDEVLAVLVVNDGVIPTDDGQINLDIGFRGASDGDRAAAGVGQRAGESAGIKSRGGDGPGHRHRAAQRHFGSVLHLDRQAGRDLGPVHKRAIFRAHVFQQEAIDALRETAVVGGNRSFRHHQIAVAAPPD